MSSPRRVAPGSEYRATSGGADAKPHPAHHRGPAGAIPQEGDKPRQCRIRERVRSWAQREPFGAKGGPIAKQTAAQKSSIQAEFILGAKAVSLKALETRG